jgi:tartrate-resistant acid phosphatase type 5
MTTITAKPTTVTTSVPARRTLAQAEREANAAGQTLQVPAVIAPFADVMFEHRHPETGKNVYIHRYGEAVHPAPSTGRPVDLGRRTLPDNELRLAVFGDSGKDNAAQRAVADGIAATIKNRGAQAAIHVGDAFYDNGLKSVEDPKFQRLFNDYYDGMGVPVYFMLGNHEYGNSAEAGSVEAVLNLAKAGASEDMVFPARSYSFGFTLKDGTAIDFFVLDTNVISSEPQQLTWLKRGLERSDAAFKIVVGHHPLHSYGLHGDQKHLQQLLLPLLEKHASAYVCGHEHDQQVLRSDGGLPLLISGAAGEARETGTGPRQRFGDDVLGFATLELNARQLRIDVRDHEGNAVYSESHAPRAAVKAPPTSRHPRLQALEARL